MSVTGLQSLFQYAIASLGQAFSPACPVQNTSDFVVTYTNATTFIDTVLTLNVDYTVTGAATAGVILTPTVTLEGTGLHYAVGGTLTIQRKNPFTQPTVYVDGNKYLAAVPNNSLDWLAYSIQALNDITARCLQVPASAAAIAPMTRTARAGKLTGFDSSGNLELVARNTVVTAVSGSYISTTTIAALKLISVSGLATGQEASVEGYYASGDGGGGRFYYNAASGVADNGGTVIAPTVGSGRWLRIYGEYVDARWFGAKGDNSILSATTNNTAIAAAFLACAKVKLGGVGLNYYVSAVIPFNQQGQTLFGEGKRLSAITWTNTNIVCIGSSSDIAMLLGCQIYGLTLQMPNAISGARIIGWKGMQFGLVDDCLLYASTTAGVGLVDLGGTWPSGSLYNVFSRVDFSLGQYGAIIGDSGNNNTFRNCRFQQTTVNSYGLYFDGSGAGYVSSNLVQACQFELPGTTMGGIYAGASVDGLTIVACRFESLLVGITAASGSKHVQVTNPYFAGCTAKITNAGVGVGDRLVASISFGYPGGVLTTFGSAFGCSVQRTGVGAYEVDFSDALPSTNYRVAVCVDNSAAFVLLAGKNVAYVLLASKNSAFAAADANLIDLRVFANDA